MKTYRKALSFLTPRERKQGLLLGAIIILMAFFELVGVASIMPFLGLLANPALIETNATLNSVYTFIGVDSVDQFLFLLGIGSFVLMVVAAFIRTGGKYALTRFIQMRRHSIAARLMEAYLRQPYEFYLHRHTGDMAKGILSEVDQVVADVFQPTANLLTQGMTLLAMILLLIFIDPYVALLVGLVLGTMYGMIFLVIRKYLARMGAERVRANRARFEATSEALGGIKDIKLLGRESSYLDKFLGPSYQMSRMLTITATLGQVPKFIVEVIAFGGILLLSLVLMARHGGHDAGALGHILPLLGVYAFAGYRMLPAIQGIYESLSRLRFGIAAIDSLYTDLDGCKHLPVLHRAAIEKMPLKKHIKLFRLAYAYPNSGGVGVQDISVDIPAGSTLGIVGSTGAGKTTLVDLILGLLPPTAGTICVDGQQITALNLRNWQANIGYVPQHIFLADASITANIALGVLEARVDHARIRQCARLARVDRFIEHELPNGYETKVGERGIRLSGGQRQRIGIARALYHDPDVIVFDEATSALDNLTEREVMAAIEALSGIKIVLIIAHRLSTVQRCDKIIVLDKGRSVGLGTWNELMAENTAFQKIASLIQAA